MEAIAAGDEKSVFFETEVDPGDVNNDDGIDLVDLLLALSLSAGGSPYGTTIYLEADIDKDNRLGVADALCIMRYIARMGSTPIGDPVNNIVLKADPTAIYVLTGVSTIQALVYDANDQPVGGQNLYFRLLHGPGGGEQLTQSVVAADNYGRASVQLKAGTLSSNHIGDVIVEAWPNATFTGDVHGSVNLTIAGAVSHIGVGVNLESVTSNPLTGHIQVGVSGIATDILGNPVADNTTVNFSVTGIAFDEDRDDDGIIHCWDENGSPIMDCATQYELFSEELGITWFSDDINGDNTMYSIGGTMSLSEDANQNGILDIGEDKNGNAMLDPPKGFTISSPKPTANGVAVSTIYYPMSYAGNVKVRISAETGGVSNYYDAVLLCTKKMQENGTCGLGY